MTQGTARSIRIGIDTGGTFTDVVAFDEDSGELVTTKTPSTPANPADGFMAGIDKVLDLLGLPEGRGDAIAAVSHGTTVATNQLLEGKVERLGFITTEGYEAMLEIARQSVPDGYGNSYFWVKPARVVPRDLVKGVGGRLDFTGAEVRPFDEESARSAARWFRDKGINTLGVCFLHSYADPGHEEQMRAVLAEEHPDAVVSLSSEVLREYREYERAMTTLIDAAVKPRLSAYVTNIKQRLAEYTSSDGQRPVPFYVMKSNGGVLSAEEVVHQPITTVLSGPAAGALGAALIAQVAGFDRVLTSDGGGTSTDVSVVIDGEPTLTTEGSVGAFPSKIPMIDVVTVGAGGGSIAWLSPEGTLKVGPQSAGADPGPLCYAKGGTEVDHHRCPRLPGPDPAAPAGRRDPPRRGGGAGRHPRARRRARTLTRGVCHRRTRDLGVEPGQRAAPGHRQARPRRPRLHADHLRWLGIAARCAGWSTCSGSPPCSCHRTPGNVSAFGLLTVDVKNDYVQTHVSLADSLDPAAVQGFFDALTDQARAALTREGFAESQHQFVRTADLRYFGQAFEVRVAVPEGAGRRRCSRRRCGPVPRRAPRALRLRLRRRPDAAGRVGQPAGLRRRPDPAPGDPALPGG